MASNRFETIGATGLVRFGGHISEEFLQALSGVKGVRAYREMRDNSATIGAALFAISSMIRQVSWDVEPGEGPGSQEAAEFLDGAIDDMSHTWANFMAEVLSELWFGWSLFEKVFKVRGGLETDDPERRSKFDDGKIGWRKFSIRAQESLEDWEFDDDGGLRGMWQNAAPDFNRVFIPIEKSLLFRTESNKNNPEGRSLLRGAYRSYFFLKRMQEIEAIGIEKDLVGFPVATLPLEYFSSNATQDQKNVASSIFKQVKKMRRNQQEAALFPAEFNHRDGKPTGFKLSLMSTGGSRQIDIGGTIMRYEKSIAMSLMSQFLFLGMDKVGSFSLSSDMTGMFATSLGAILDGIEGVINRFAVEELMAINGFRQEDWPKIKHGDIEKEDTKRLSEVLSSYVNAGVVTPDAGLEDFVRTKIGAPSSDDAEDDLEVFGAPLPRGNTTPVDDVPDDVKDLSTKKPEGE